MVDRVIAGIAVKGVEVGMVMEAVAVLGCRWKG